jgi:hypothetical protein
LAKGRTHESTDHRDQVKMGSERSFGIVFATVFLVVALWPLTGGNPVRWWSLGLSAVFVLLAFAWPVVLRPLNVVWFKFGMLLSKIMTPLVMGLLFVVTFVPMGLIARYVARADLLRLKLEPDSDSYWIRRSPPGPDPSTMKNQF